MAKKLIRLNVVVTPAQHSLLAELGELQGRSSASFLREMLDAATPMLEASLPVWRAVAQEASAQPERLRALIVDTVADLALDASQLDMLALIARTAPGANDPAETDGKPSGASAPAASAASSKKARRR